MLDKFCLNQIILHKAVVPVEENQISLHRDKNMLLIYFATSPMSLLTLVTSTSFMARNALSSQKRLVRN